MPLPSPFHSISRHSLSASLVPTDSPKRSGKLNKTQVGLKENMWVSVDEVPSVHMLTSVKNGSPIKRGFLCNLLSFLSLSHSA